MKTLSDFPKELELGSQPTTRPERMVSNAMIKGYCIRTGVEIPFNPNKPMCEKAYSSWAMYKNYDYKESFCHKTGKPSNGKTSMRHPIL